MAAVPSLIEFVLIMFLGFFIGKRKIFSGNAISDLSNFVTKIAIPLLILSTINSAGTIENKGEAVNYLIMSFLSYFVFIIAAELYVRIAKVPHGSRGVMKFLVVFNNSGFIGFPLIHSMYGEEGMFYAVLTSIPFYLLAYSYGIYVMTSEKEDEDKKLDVKSIVTAPGFIAAIISLMAFSFNLTIPTFFSDLFGMVGTTSTPMAMLVIGLSISTMNFKDSIRDSRVYKLLIYKMIFLPIITYFIFSPLIGNEILTTILVIIAAMPGPTMATSFAVIYDNDEIFSSRYIAVSTVLSVIIIPAILFIIELV